MNWSVADSFYYFWLKGLLSVTSPSENHLLSVRKYLLSVDFPHKSPPFCRKAHSFCQGTPEIASFLSKRTFFPSGCPQKTAFFLSGIPQKLPPFYLKAPSFCQVFPQKITSFLSESIFFLLGFLQKMTSFLSESVFFLSSFPQKSPPFYQKVSSFCQAFIRKSPPFCQQGSSFCQVSLRNRLLSVTKCLLSIRFPSETNSFLSVSVIFLLGFPQKISSFLSESVFLLSGFPQTSFCHKVPFFSVNIFLWNRLLFVIKHPSPHSPVFLRKSPPFCQKVSSFGQFSFRNHLLFVTKCLLSVRFLYEISSLLSWYAFFCQVSLLNCLLSVMKYLLFVTFSSEFTSFLSDCHLFSVCFPKKSGYNWWRWNYIVYKEQHEGP